MLFLIFIPRDDDFTSIFIEETQLSQQREKQWREQTEREKAREGSWKETRERNARKTQNENRFLGCARRSKNSGTSSAFSLATGRQLAPLNIPMNQFEKRRQP